MLQQWDEKVLAESHFSIDKLLEMAYIDFIIKLNKRLFNSILRSKEVNDSDL